MCRRRTARRSWAATPWRSSASRNSRRGIIQRGSVEETRRGYYVRGHEELRAAGRTFRHYIHHAAAGVPYCVFAIGGTHFSLGGADPYLLFNLFAAHNAARRFLETAGRGEMLQARSAPCGAREHVWPR